MPGRAFDVHAALHPDHLHQHRSRRCDAVCLTLSRTAAPDRGPVAMTSKKPLSGLLARAPLATAVALALFSAPAAQAFEFERGGFTGSWDTTVSYGISQRTEEQDPELIGKAWFNPLLCRQNVNLSAPVGPF